MFGKELEKMILERYDNKKKFADECKISAGHLNDFIKGRSFPKEEILNKIFLKLSLNEKKKEYLLEEWAHGKSSNILREKINKLETENSNMKDVLKNLDKEIILKEKVDSLKAYEDFYNLIFKDLTLEEKEEMLNVIMDKVKLLAIEKNKYEDTKEKINLIKDKINQLK